MKMTMALAHWLRFTLAISALSRPLTAPAPLVPSRFGRLLALAALLLGLTADLRAQGTAFTFQGRLTDSGAPANGLYDFQFALRDALTAGNAVGTPLTLNPVGVTNGLFSVTLDFGAGVFNGSARWIEIGARTNGSASGYTVLTPRTSVAPVPYAMFVNTDALAAQIATVTSQVSALSNLVSVLTNQVLTLTNQVTGLTNQVSGLTNQVTVLTNQVLTLTNQVTVLTTSNTALATQLAAVSNYFTTNLPAGVPVVSSDVQDPVFLAQGLQLFQTVPAPPWVNGTVTGVPSARAGHSAVWTGQQLMVWGGDLGSGSYSAGGGAYSPASDVWQNFTAFQAPSARAGHTAVWTGTEMIIWGGSGAAGFATTASRYHRINAEWNAVSTASAPAARDGHTALWTGSRMVIFSGRNGTGLLADGGAYDPVNNSWSALPTTDAPEGRRFATAVWTGASALYWGGQGVGGELASGGRLDCNAGLPQSWQPIATTGAPAARTRHTAVWTGSKMIVWGGQQSGVLLGDGAAYDPGTDTWTNLPLVGAPVARAGHVAVWSGTELLIYGGEDSSGTPLASGGAYDPVKNKWRTLDTATGALARTSSTAVWSGSELILFGGQSASGPLAALQRLTPQPAFYFFRKP